MSSIKCITFEEELKKNPELKLSDIQILKEWCKKQPHLPKIDDVQFAIFLHCNYFRIEPTKNTIESYYTIRTHVPLLFSYDDLRNAKHLQDASKVVANIYLDGKTKEGYTIMLTRIIDSDYTHFVHEDVIHICMMMLDEFIWTHGSSPGIVFISDFHGLTMGHMTRLNLTIVKHFMYYIQEALLMRMKAIHIINISPITQMVMNIIKPLMKQDFLNMIHWHSTMEDLSKYIPIEALPNELGGKSGTLAELVDMQVKKMENFHEWFLEDKKINRVNEALRIGTSKTSSDLFGMEGNFKKLDFD